MILFIDCYDSFSYNLTRLIETACSGEEVVVTHNDLINGEQLTSFLPFLKAIIIGPGPGDPRNPADSGVIEDLWNIVAYNPIPVFGICFGYQSMVRAFGGKVDMLHPPQHGRVGKIEHDESSVIFHGVPSQFNAVRYHSLHSLAKAPLRCTAIDRITTPTQPIEMAAEHESLPFYGVQFHPESVLSTYGLQLFDNFWQAASIFNKNHRKIVSGSIPSTLKVTEAPLIEGDYNSKSGSDIDLAIKELPKIPWKQVVSKLGDTVIIKSAAAPGKWSIFGLLEPGVTPHIRSKNGVVYDGTLYSAPAKTIHDLTFWEYAAQFMKDKLISPQVASEINGAAQLPFLGGLIGYITYEGSCQYTIDKASKSTTFPDSPTNSDFSMVFVNKCIIINEDTNDTYAVGPSEWARYMENSMSPMVMAAHRTTSESFPLPLQKQPETSKTPFNVYKKSFDQCQDKLESGDSYELCLTSQAKLKFDHSVDPWLLFLHLIERNPAPYCSLMAFDDVLIATSPERFMCWDYEFCEFRPIKGTVRKSASTTREKAEQILRTPKEQAENLMIVDLIRHDLNHLLKDVTTPQLMTVEEYHSVFQLVTSVRGRLIRNGSKGLAKPSGIDLLSQSLPPGSMTGAPKQRSVEILRDIETEPRGIYSGVHGYWSIDDRGDWSVIIRSLFRSKHDKPSEWRLGAGGAVTVLSTADQEYEEMTTKMDSVLNAFQ